MKYNKYLTLKLILGLTASMVLIIAESVNYYGMYGGLIFSIALNLAFGAYLILSWKHFIFPINNKVMEVWFSLLSPKDYRKLVSSKGVIQNEVQ
ncbi:hypothetical protein [Tepidibacillus marianensis]|uniref:hypothetical protein n=1 Tax=Tepidibacillus marianensis TaxID=3131995 RepID=UPI0030CC312F